MFCRWRLRTGCFLWGAILFGGLISAPSEGRSAPGGGVEVLVHGQSSDGIAGVAIQLKAQGQVVATGVTDAAGHLTLAVPHAGTYDLAASKEGFEPLRKSDVSLSPETPASIDLTLVPKISHAESIDVHETVSPVEEGASAPSALPAETVKELPSRPATVADVLPLVPGVTRSPGGGLQISGAGEHRSAFIVNSADVTDPATGQFGLTVPIDSVQSVNVFQTPFLAEYGRFTAGLVSVETRRGGDKWHWELNDPLPEFRIRSYHMRGLRDATPRLNLEGPLIRGKLYFSEGLEYAIRKTAVYELPFPWNQKVQEGVNSFAQLDWLVSSRQWVTGTVHVAPQRLGNVNMDFYNPQGTTPDAATHNYTATLADRISLGGGLLENTFSLTDFTADVWGQGNQGLIVTPAGNAGNYFAQQNRHSSRLSWVPVYSFRQTEKFGAHNFKMGAYAAHSSDDGQVTEHPIDILDPTNRLLERIGFTGGQPFRMSDRELAFFGQDHWLVTPHLSLDLGIRTESQVISEAFRVAPRVGIAWSPFSRLGTVVRAGFGFFYDRVPLDVYSFSHFPSRVITYYDAAGAVSAGPFVYRNVLGQVTAPFALVSQEPVAGNFSPRSATGSIQVEQPLGHALKLRFGYMQNEGSGLVVLNPSLPNPATAIGTYSLSGTGTSRYHQFEATARVRLGAERELVFSYVRSRARGDLNDFSGFLGSFPTPVVRPNQYSYLSSDLPNRFLAWGLWKFPYGFRVAPVVELRTGFPYIATDALQNYAGLPNLTRFPDFISVDARFSKDIKVNPKYTVRLSISAYNMTNHFNPEAVRSNVADPAFGYFFGQRGRRFTADFDVIF